MRDPRILLMSALGAVTAAALLSACSATPDRDPAPSSPARLQRLDAALGCTLDRAASMNPLVRHTEAAEAARILAGVLAPETELVVEEWQGPVPWTLADADRGLPEAQWWTVRRSDGTSVGAVALAATAGGFDSAAAVPCSPAADGDPLTAQARATQQVADTLPGLAEADAVATVEAAGLVARVVARDGESYPMTMDYQGTRVNLVITNGLVDTVSVG